mmetsp:Transcript_7714/g.11534  ORF Transcript_7714/g.11534 Transcript_7714/m.11534 type:complete len:245 (-) Transcript_7714:24-758(-)
MRALALSSLNLSRYELLIRNFLKLTPVQAEIIECGREKLLNNSKSLLEQVNVSNEFESFSPATIAQSEPILSLLWPSRPMAITPFYHQNHHPHQLQQDHHQSNSNYRRFIHLWHSPSNLVTRFNEKDIQNTLTLFKNEKYMIFRKNRISIDRKHERIEGISSLAREEDIYLCVSRNCSSIDQLKAIFEAHLNSQVLDVMTARLLMKEFFPIFIDILMRNNWNVVSTQLRKKGSLVYDVVYSDDN